MAQSMLTLHPKAQGIHGKNLYFNLKIAFVHAMQNRVIDTAKRIAPELGERLEDERRRTMEEFSADGAMKVFDPIYEDIGLDESGDESLISAKIAIAVDREAHHLIAEITREDESDTITDESSAAT